MGLGLEGFLWRAIDVSGGSRYVDELELRVQNRLRQLCSNMCESGWICWRSTLNIDFDNQFQPVHQCIWRLALHWIIALGVGNIDDNINSQWEESTSGVYKYQSRCTWRLAIHWWNMWKSEASSMFEVPTYHCLAPFLPKNSKQGLFWLAGIANFSLISAKQGLLLDSHATLQNARNPQGQSEVWDQGSEGWSSHTFANEETCYRVGEKDEEHRWWHYFSQGVVRYIYIYILYMNMYI